jgi:Na+/H+ antiporter NhaD/arsenite permease-like protein
MSAMEAARLLASAPGPTTAVVAIFRVVYLGMVLGRLPGLQLDRTGVALLGALAMVGLGTLTPQQALLSALFSNDIVCLAVAPVLARGCPARRLDPVPFLRALACAANIGSAATLIGNPQNMLIGSVLELPFAAYLRDALPPVLAGLVLLWWLLARGLTGSAPPVVAVTPDAPDLDRWQAAKGLAVAVVLLGVFLFSNWPHDVASLVGAGRLLLSRRFRSSQTMSLIDWDLLILSSSTRRSRRLAPVHKQVPGCRRRGCTWATRCRCLLPPWCCPTWCPTCRR